MKKQIFTLALLVLAIFAGTTTAFGQCDNALSPMAGKPYTYSVSVDPAGGEFDWYVTTSTNLLTGTPLASGDGEIIGGTGYNDPGNGTASVTITWTAQAVANAQSGTNYYLVVKYTTSCSDNLKPWAITPLNLFQILVENVDGTGTALTDDEVCRSEVAGATINSSNQVVYDYGENALYLKVTANNFTTSWTPAIDMAALNASLTSPQSVTSAEWSLSTTFNGTNTFDLTTGVSNNVVPDKGGDNVTTGTDELIYIRIVIDHGKFEGTTDQDIALNISAVDVAGNTDVDKDAACVDITPDPDNVTQTILARPGITNPTPSPFITPEP